MPPKPPAPPSESPVAGVSGKLSDEDKLRPAGTPADVSAPMPDEEDDLDDNDDDDDGSLGPDGDN